MRRIYHLQRLAHWSRDAVISRQIQGPKIVVSSGMFAPTCIPEYDKPALFERLPGPRKRLLGLDCHSLEELAHYDLIRIIEVIRPGRKHPIKLVHVPSLLAYIERVEQLARNKRLAEIRAGYAHHHAGSQEGQSLEAKSPGKVSFLEMVPKSELKP